MDFNNPVSTNLADNRALRSMVMHTKDDTTHQFVPMEEGAKGLINGVRSALQRVKKVAQLPDENTSTGSSAQISLTTEHYALW